MSNHLPFLILMAVAVLFFWLGFSVADDSTKARKSCAEIGMFAESHSGEWVCVNRPEFKRVPK